MRIAFVCLGNICRSPTAEVVTRRLLEQAGLDDVTVDSCGTGGQHTGEPMDPRTAQVLSAAGYDPTQHRARRLDATWHDHDLLLVMDRSNEADVLDRLPAERHDRVVLFRSYDPEVSPAGPVPDVPDPWYGGEQGFAEVLAIVERTSRALVDSLAAR
jgi:protein-tyrosine phosphatase